MNVPKIRFRKFSEDWYCDKLSTYAKKITSKNKNLEVKNVISNSAVYGLISQRDFFDKDIANETNIDSYYIINNNDFVYNPRKSNEAPYGPINRYSSNEKGVISPLYLCFNINNKINSLYLEKYFKSNKWHRYIYLNGDAGARHDRVSIKDDVFFDLKMYLPSKIEQEKIGLFLTLLDKKIELQSKKIEALKLYKSSTQSKLLSKEYFDKFETSLFEDVCNIQTGKSNTQDKDENGIYPFYIRSEEIQKSNKYIFDCEAVLTIGDGNIGKVFFYENGKFDCHQRVYVLNNFRNVLGKYLYYYFELNFYKRAISMSAKNTVDSVRQEMISKMKIDIPEEKQQIQIINILDKINYKYELEKDKLNRLVQLKKGLMQNMFV